jgi:hypothetical protein
MVRTLTLCGLLLAAFAVGAAQKDKDEKPKAKTYKTPQEVFDAAAASMRKKDFAVMVSCFTPEARHQMALDLAMQGLFFRGKAEDDEKMLTRFKPVFEVMDKHGLTKAATKDVKIKGFRPSKEDRAAIRKLVKDPAAFAAAYLTAQEKTSEGRDKDDPKPALKDLKIDGDKASGNIVVTFKVKSQDKDAEELRERKQPVTFSKINGGWLIDPGEEPKDAPAPPKDKDRKKD